MEDQGKYVNGPRFSKVKIEFAKVHLYNKNDGTFNKFLFDKDKRLLSFEFHFTSIVQIFYIHYIYHKYNSKVECIEQTVDRQNV